MKKLIATAAASLALVTAPVMASSSGEALCQYVGELAEAIALDRDDGMTHEELRRDVIVELYDHPYLEVSLATLNRVYTRPHLAPESEGGSAFMVCSEAIRGTAL